MQEPFISFLRELGVDADATPFKKSSDDDESESKSRPGSRLKPWACHCTRIWASVGKKVNATCNNCKSTFDPQYPQIGG
jgi:hypothetical protein